MSTDAQLPLEGIRVLELSHTVMGPTCGLILADMGADVYKVERTAKGDDTRWLKGFGAGFFTYFNRNKKSISLDLKSAEGKQILLKLIEEADVLIENFGPGTLDRLGVGFEVCQKVNPKLIYCSLKGFMPGPYEHRPALDEVVQMMGGLAYMTGPSGRPLRAGASVTDILGGSYGAIGILAALFQRQFTGRGQLVQATLFESVAFLMGQRMCETFGFQDWGGDQRLSSNQGRIEAREWFLPELQKRFAALPKGELMSLAEKAGIPFAPVNKPVELQDDPQMAQSGSLADVRTPEGDLAKLPKIPLRLDGRPFELRLQPPRIGEGSLELYRRIGFTDREIERLQKEKIIQLEA
jgi:crotonobetainyl-CoA:carnitine CoA-transferase CaiB-like acyl-CoA transferase